MISNPDYGIDAPPVISGLYIAGILFCAGASFGLAYGIYSLILFMVIIFFGLLFITIGLLMRHSSKKGKISERDKLIDSLKLNGNETFLDLGCGKGLLLIAAAKKLKSGKAIGIDTWNAKDLAMNHPETTIHNALLENVRDRVEVITGDMRNLPLRENSVDIIAASMAIHNVNSKQERKKTMQEINRVLKPGGKIAILDFKCTDEYVNELKELGRSNVSLSELKFGMFPPVRIVTVN